MAGVYQAIWLLSNCTSAVIIDSGKGPYGAAHSIDYVTVAYLVGNKEYHETYLRNEIGSNVDSIDIKYLKFAPSFSRPDNLSGNWGIVFSIFLVYFLVLTIAFLRPDIIPKDKNIRFSFTRPFVSVVDKM